MDYMVVRGSRDSFEKFINEVNALLEQGYELVGGVSNAAFYAGGTTGTVVYFAQALIKE